MEKEYSGMTQGELDEIKRNLVQKITENVDMGLLDKADILLKTLIAISENK